MGLGGGGDHPRVGEGDLDLDSAKRISGERDRAQKTAGRPPADQLDPSQITPENLLQMIFGGGLGTPFGGSGVPGPEGGRFAPGQARQIGEFGGVPLVQADVRTPFMRGLEAASAPILLQSLLNPFQFAADAQQNMGMVPGAAGAGDLLTSLLGGGAPSTGPVAGGFGTGLFPPAGAGGEGSTPEPTRRGREGPTGGFGGGGGGGGKPDVNFFAQGGKLIPEDINVVGEAGPEAVVGDQVVPLGLQPSSGNQAQPLMQALTGGQGLGVPQGLQSIVGGNQAQPLSQQPTGGGLDMNAVNTITGVQSPAGGQSGRGAQTQANFTQARGGVPDNVRLPGSQQTNAQAQVAQLLGQSGGGGFGTGVSAGGQTIQSGENMNPLAQGSGQFPTGTQQGAGTGMIQRLLEQNPEQQAFGVAQDFLTGGQGGAGGLLGQSPGAGVIGAAEPVFQRNLDFALGRLRNQAPNVFGSGLALQGTDLAGQALQDFNLFSQQAAQQGIGQQLQGLSTLGQLAGPAGQNPFQRALGAGQFGLAAREQAFNQTVNPTIQMLMAAFQQASPTGFQTSAIGAS